MIVKTYREDEYIKAQEIQRELVSHNQPSPPLMRYKIERLNGKGETTELWDIKKCNSYTRNGLNLMAANMLLFDDERKDSLYQVNGVFGDGWLNCKNNLGVMYPNNANQIRLINYYKSSTESFPSNNSTYICMFISTDTSETLDMYEFNAVVGQYSSGYQTKRDFNPLTNLLKIETSVIISNTLSTTITGYSFKIAKPLAFRLGTSGSPFKAVVIMDTLPEPLTIEPGESVRVSYIYEYIMA